jgi:hypothetical protein
VSPQPITPWVTTTSLLGSVVDCGMVTDGGAVGDDDDDSLDGFVVFKNVCCESFLFFWLMKLSSVVDVGLFNAQSSTSPTADKHSHCRLVVDRLWTVDESRSTSTSTSASSPSKSKLSDRLTTVEVLSLLSPSP